MSLQVATAQAAVVRDGHFETLSGVDTRALLLEAASTNLLLRSQEFDNGGAWNLSATVTANAAVAPDGTTTADLLNDTSAVALQVADQTATLPSDSLQYTSSMWAKMGTSRYCALTPVGINSNSFTVVAVFDLQTGTVTATSGSQYVRSSVTAYANGWYRISVTVLNNASGVTGLHFEFYPAWNATGSITSDATTTGSVYAWGAQLEAQPVPTSYIATASVTVTRSVDSFYLPFPYTPQETTFYTKHVERGTTLTTSAFLWSVSDSAVSSPRVFVQNAGANNYYAHHDGAGPSVQTVGGPAVSFGDIVELRLVLGATGSLLLGQSINGAAETVSTLVAGNGLATAWSANRLYLMSANSAFASPVAFLAAKAVRGTKTLAEMRAA